MKKTGKAPTPVATPAAVLPASPVSTSGQSMTPQDPRKPWP
jgi:hypothetical protein